MYADSPYSHDPYSVAAPVNAGVLAVSQVVTAVEGSVTGRFTYTMTGQVITAQLGNETVRTTYRVIGQQVAAQEGMVSVRTAYNVAGQVITSQLGNETVLFGAVIYPSGNLMSGILNPPTVRTTYFVNGQQMRVNQGEELIWSLEDNAVPTIWVPVIAR